MASGVRGVRLEPGHRGVEGSPALWYFKCSGGNNSVVECDLAKVEVAGSNPVSRSNTFLAAVGRAGRVRPAVRLFEAPSPRGKAEVCKTSTPGSNPGGASNLNSWMSMPRAYEEE